VNSKTPVIQLKNVSKTFGEVRSLSEVNIEIYPGEIVGLLGDNGAGKSTLVKTIMGFHRPDEGGEIWFKGEKINDWNVAKARELGIETIYQERALCEQQPIWRNMFMGREIKNKFGRLDVKKMKSEATRLMSEHMGFTSTAVHPDNAVLTMSGGEKQGVAITFIQNIKKSGRSAIFIDHNIFHIYPAVDRMIVLDRGKVAGNYKKSDITMDELIESMYRVARTGSIKE